MTADDDTHPSERYQRLFESIDEGFCVIELIFDGGEQAVDYRFLEINPTFEKQIGFAHPPGETGRQHRPTLDESWLVRIGPVAVTGESIRFESYVSAMNRWFDVFAFRVDQPERRRVALLCNDISERKVTELNATLLADVCVDFGGVSEPAEIMAMVGERLCRHFHAVGTAFMEVDDAAGLATVVFERRESGGLKDLAGVYRLSDLMSESLLLELRAGKVVAIGNGATDPPTEGGGQGGKQFDEPSWIHAPHYSEGQWKFMLSVHAGETHRWWRSDINLMRELSARVWLRLERARAEESLRRSEQQARAFFECSGVGAVQVGPDRRFKKVNDRYCQITGYSREELGRMTPLELDHPDELEADRERFRCLFEDPNYTYDVEKRYLRKDGRIYWVHVNARAIRDAEGNPLYTAAIIEDITDRKQAEEALRESEKKFRELSRSLEQRVMERTIELQELTVRLRHLAAELASTEQRERKRLAALLHDHLQQLLVASSMHLKNAGRRMKDEVDRQSVEQVAMWIGEATSAARDLTRQLRPPALYEDSLIAALHGLAIDMAERHNLKVTIEDSESNRPMSDDVKALLFESIRELLFNAAKYADVEEAVVRVWEEGTCLNVAVEDLGKGFDTETAVRSRSRGGFGLFSIRERLAALGGKFSIASAPEEGTRVMLEVPFLPGIPEREPDLPERNPSDNLRAMSPQVQDIDRRTRILVVDDHAMVRQGLSTILGEDERLVVVGEAGDGLEAINAVERHRPHVVLIDLNMPNMNGIEATREIYRRWPETIIIGLSVQDDDATGKAVRDAGAAAFLSKAGDSDQMIATIVELMKLARYEKDSRG